MYGLNRIVVGMTASFLFASGGFAQSPYGEKHEFRSEWRGKQDTVFGYLSLPKVGPGPFPAVMLVHGSGGIGEREARYVVEYNQMGIATFAVDSFTPRGVTSTTEDQSKVSALAMVSDVFAAFKLLSENPGIDKKRIALQGGSKGGTVAIDAAMQRAMRVRNIPEEHKFAAHISLYPGCGVQYRTPITTGAPILILLGGRDDYTGGPNCPQYAEAIKKAGGKIDVIVYPSGKHAFDGKDLQGHVDIKHAQNFSKCLVYVEDDGRFVYAKNGEVLDSPKKFFDVQAKDCMYKGASMGTDKEVKKKSLEDVQSFLKGTLLAQ